MRRENYPTAMQKFRRRHSEGKSGPDFGFALPNEDVFRFCQRYRVSKSFQRIHLRGYSSATTTGYSALFKILLTWSAFERFLKLVNKRQNVCKSLLAPYEPEKTIKRIRAIDKKGNFYRFLAGQVNATHQTELQNYFQRKLFNVTYLASAVRHIFAHGSLTAHPNRTQPATIKQISDVLCKFLLRVLDSEFAKRIDQP